MSKLTDRIAYSTMGAGVVIYILTLFDVISYEASTNIFLNLILIMILCIIFKNRKGVDTR